jgi:hypothetical protein
VLLITVPHVSRHPGYGPCRPATCAPLHLSRGHYGYSRDMQQGSGAQRVFGND